MVSKNYFCGSSLNEVAQCLTADQVMMVKFYPGKTLPVEVITYPVFEKEGYLENSTVVYVTCSEGYYHVQIIVG